MIPVVSGLGAPIELPDVPSRGSSSGFLIYPERLTLGMSCSSRRESLRLPWSFQSLTRAVRAVGDKVRHSVQLFLDVGTGIPAASSCMSLALQAGGEDSDLVPRHGPGGDPSVAVQGKRVAGPSGDSWHRLEFVISCHSNGDCLPRADRVGSHGRECVRATGQSLCKASL